MQIIPRIIEYSLLYYAQHEPSELAHFDWVIDAKNTKITSYEQLWKDLVSPILQMRSLSDPITFCKDEKFNYRYFDKSFATTIPEYLKPHFPISEQSETVCDIKKMMESLTFQQSKDVIGLHLVDILVNGVRRLLNKRLSIDCAQVIGTLMVGKGEKVINFITMSSTIENQVIPRHAFSVNRELRKFGRELFK